jgi:hypothetical protein
MQHSLLVYFLNGEIAPKAFDSEIKQEVNACEEGIRSKAKVGHIVITDGPQTIVTRDHMRRLLQYLLDESVPWTSLNYTADCLMMSEDFEPEDEKAAEAIEFLSDDSRPPSPAETRGALEALR